MLNLSHYLGPSIDVGPAMTTRIIMERGKVLHRSIYRLLSMKGWGPEYYQEMEDVGIRNTPQYDPYEGETQNKQMFPQLVEELEPIPEMIGHIYEHTAA